MKSEHAIIEKSVVATTPPFAASETISVVTPDVTATTPAVATNQPAAVALASQWQAYHAGYSGVLRCDPRFKNVDAFEVVLPPVNTIGGVCVLKLEAFAPQDRITPILAKARAQFDLYLVQYRDKVKESDEYRALKDATDAIEKVQAKAAQLKPKVADAEKARDELLAADDDTRYAQLDAEAHGLRDRLNRLDAERERLESLLPNLQRDLQNRANAIAAEKAIEAESDLEPRLADLCGLLNGKPAALDELILLNELRTQIRGSISGAQLARRITEELSGRPIAEDIPMIPAIAIGARQIIGRIGA